MVGLEGGCARQAVLTFAMARHAVVDLAQVFDTPPREALQPRLTDPDLARLRARLAEGGVRLRDEADDAAGQRLAELRRMYEPYVAELARYLAVTLPPWMRAVERPDNWQTSRWERPLQPPRRAPPRVDDDHF